MAIGSNNVGFSFDPGPQSLPAGGQPRAPGGQQSAVQVKSFTLPNRVVPGQIAPQALLQSPGGGGQMNVDLLRRLMAMFAPSGQQPGVPGIPSQPGAFPQGTGYHTQPVPMGPQPQTPPFHTQPVPMPGQGGEVPLEHTPTPVPRVGPGDTERTGAGALPEPAPLDLRDLFGGTPSGGVQNPLGRKFDQVQGLFG